MPVQETLASVVLPVYNAGAVVSACITSVLQQTFTEWELIIVNDGSTDESGSIADHYAALDQRIRVIHQPNAGVAIAFQNGVDTALGSFIARMDADDVMLPRRLELQYNFLKTHPDVGLVSGLVEFGGSREHQNGYALHVDWLNTLRTHEEIFQARFIESPVANPSVMFRKEIWKKHGGPREGNFPEDYEQWLRWLEQGVRFGKVLEAVIIWNDPPTRLTRNDNRYSPEAFARVKTQYVLQEIVRHYDDRKIAVCGAGRVTRKRYRELLDELEPMMGCYVDVAPQRVGKTIERKPVVTLDSINDPDENYVLVLTAMHGAREVIKSNLIDKGFVNGKDFVLV